MDKDAPSIDDIIETYKTGNDFKKALKPSLVDRCADYVKTSFKGSTKMNKGFVYALAASIGANLVVSYILNHTGVDSDTIQNMSYWAELVAGSAVFISNYSYNRIKQGADKKQVFKELLRIGITGFCISYPLYKPARADLSSFIENIGVSSSYSASISQVLLLFPFLVVMDLLAKPMKYIIDTGKDITERMIDATKEYMNGNDYKKNDSEKNSTGHII